MSSFTARRDLDRNWRASEFVVSYPEKGQYPTGTVHRSKCVTLSEESRAIAYEPSSVHETTLEKLRKDANSYHIGNKLRVCRRCCKDIELVGCRVEGEKPEKIHSLSGGSYTKTEIEDLVKALESYQNLSGGDDEARIAVTSKLLKNLKGQLKGLPRR